MGSAKQDDIIFELPINLAGDTKHKFIKDNINRTRQFKNHPRQESVVKWGEIGKWTSRADIQGPDVHG